MWREGATTDQECVAAEHCECVVGSMRKYTSALCTMHDDLLAHVSQQSTPPEPPSYSSAQANLRQLSASVWCGHLKNLRPGLLAVFAVKERHSKPWLGHKGAPLLLFHPPPLLLPRALLLPERPAPLLLLQQPIWCCKGVDTQTDKDFCPIGGAREAKCACPSCNCLEAQACYEVHCCWF